MADELQPIEGDRCPRFRAFTLDRDGHPDGECVFECERIEDLYKFRRRQDQRYKWKVDGHWMTSTEFETWKNSQDQPTGDR